MAPSIGKPTPKKDNVSSPVIMIAIGALGLIVGLFVYLQLFNDAAVVDFASPIPKTDNLYKFNSINFDFSIFDNPRFKSLKIFGELPVKPGVTGKADLFAPF